MSAQVKKILILSAAAGLSVAMIVALISGSEEEAPKVKPALKAKIKSKPRKVVTKTDAVLVAKKNITPGTRVSSDFVTWKEFKRGPKSKINNKSITRSRTPYAIEEFSGKIARSAISSGAELLTTQLLDAKNADMVLLLAKGMRAVSVEVNVVNTAGGFILPGNHVDVISTVRLTKTANRSASNHSKTTIKNARVLAIDQRVTAAGSKSLVAKRTATLEVTPKEAELLTSIAKGTVSLALRSAHDSTPKNIKKKASNNNMFKMFLNGSRSNSARAKKKKPSLKIIRYGRQEVILKKRTPKK